MALIVDNRVSGRLVAIKVAHTLIWAFLGGCVLAIPIVSWHDRHRAAAWLAATVAGEVVVLLLNDRRCPLTALAARYTSDRRYNFDIYLPLWLARYNKPIFGLLNLAGLVFAVTR